MSTWTLADFHQDLPKPRCCGKEFPGQARESPRVDPTRRRKGTGTPMLRKEVPPLFLASRPRCGTGLPGASLGKTRFPAAPTIILHPR